MAKKPDDLFAYLETIGIAVTTISHAPLRTVEESQALRETDDGRADGHTKNLFLKDRKGRYFLVTAQEDAVIDLKSLHTMIGASGRLSFGKPEAMQDLLGVIPGAVTPFGVINDKEGEVCVVLDEALMRSPSIHAHPLTNEATSSIASDDLVKFLKATGHEPQILKVSTENPM